MAERRETIQFNALYPEMKEKNVFLSCSWNFNRILKTPGKKKVYFSFIIHTTLAVIKSKSGRSIMHVTVSCLIIHFGCNQIGFKTNVERARKDR